MVAGKRLTAGRVLLGLVLAGVGLLVLIDELGWAGSRGVLERWWPVIPVAWGCYHLVSAARFRVIPAIVAGVGVILILSLDRLQARFGDSVWALAIVLAGLLIASGLAPTAEPPQSE